MNIEYILEVALLLLTETILNNNSHLSVVSLNNYNSIMSFFLRKLFLKIIEIILKRLIKLTISYLINYLSKHSQKYINRLLLELLNQIKNIFFK